MPKIIFLWTDVALFALLAAVWVYAWHVSRVHALRAVWGRVVRSAPAMCSAVVLSFFVLIGLLDSLHYQPRLPAVDQTQAEPVYAPKVVSVLDALLDQTAFARPEKTYSAPLAWSQFTKESMLQEGGEPYRDFPRLRFGGKHLQDPDAQWAGDVVQRGIKGLLAGAAVGLGLVLLVGWARLLRVRLSSKQRSSPPLGVFGMLAQIWRHETVLPWRAILLTTIALCLVFGCVFGLSSGYHVLGTDRTGQDVFGLALKSIRTAWVIGSLTTIAMLPPAMILGIAAGYFKGWVDDVIQYIYTTLTSIPGVLLIAACVLLMQVYLDTHPDLFPTALQRADLRLFLLCVILGLTGWSGLCRMLRAEVLKLRELEYVQAARAFGISHGYIMLRHLVPNVMHIVLMTVVLEFSGLVLYEAVLSYLGIGVDPTMHSFGAMIEKSRFEMSRDPMIWWNLLAAFSLMLAMILASNLFADAVRDAFDPRRRMFRARRLSRTAAAASALAVQQVRTPCDAAEVTRLDQFGSAAERRTRHDMPVLRIADLDVAVDSGEQLRFAVKALALSVSRGETFALVGESGSGKSMTAMALMRLLPEALRVLNGTIELAGVELNCLPEFAMRRVRGGRMGMIFQEPATSLNPVMRIGAQLIEAIELHTELRGPSARSRAVHWLSRVGIPDPATRIDDYPFQFSGGQKQRIMIAIALAAEPELLIADEPTTALDATVQAQVLRLLADIQKEMGMAVLLITHDLAVVSEVADTVALMRGGEIVETADARAFFASPRHPYALALFNAIPSYAKRGRPLSRDGQGRIAAFAESSQDLLLEVKGLSVDYPIRKGVLQRITGWNQVVQGVAFSLRAGETLALVGASGCGKTTVAKALLQLIDSSVTVRGSALMHQRDLLHATDCQARRQIQIVFQDPYASLDPRMRIGAILQEGMAALRSEWTHAEQMRRIASLLDRVGLPADCLMRFPHEFSGGQRQRIAIARALAVEPQVLILDEPTSALDVSVQAQILDLLTDLQRETGMAFLFITHNFSVVEYLADRVAVMDAGKLVEVGTTDQVLHHPKHLVTQSLLASVPRVTFHRTQ